MHQKAIVNDSLDTSVPGESHFLMDTPESGI